MTENIGPPSGDRRVRKTRASIQTALVDLIVEKGYDSVTVTDIIHRADVGRSTFYAHFTDKHDVFNDMMEGLTDFLASSERDPAGRLFSFSLPMYAHIAEQRQVISVLFGPGGSPVAQESIRNALRDCVRAELVERAHPHHARISRELMADAVVGAYLAIAGHFFTGDREYSAAELDEVFRALVTPGVEAALEP